MRGNRSADAFMRRGGRHRIDETLAGGAHEQRQAERLELREPSKTNDTLFRRLAEADSGVEHDTLSRNAGTGRDLERTSKEGLHIGNDIDAGIGGLEIVH